MCYRLLVRRFQILRTGGVKNVSYRCVFSPTCRWCLSLVQISGKSTLIGVLSSSGLDDGRGAARSLVLRHRHEQENGRTSAVTMEIMGYAKDGQQVLSSGCLNGHVVFSRSCTTGLDVAGN